MGLIANAWNTILNRGSSTSKTVSAATTNATVVKASPGRLVGVRLSNTNASARYVKFHDTASAPTAGTTTVKLCFLIPGATTGCGSTENFNPGIRFESGIAFTTTTGAADNDTGAVAANEVIINVIYG